MSSGMDELAAIYVIADPDQDRWTEACRRYCAEQGYNLAAVVLVEPGDDGARWAQVHAMADRGELDVLVVARRDQLPRRRRPRVEVVAEMPDRRHARHHNRPRIIR